MKTNAHDNTNIPVINWYCKIITCHDIGANNFVIKSTQAIWLRLISSKPCDDGNANFDLLWPDDLLPDEL